jgi:hypothetical protein
MPRPTIIQSIILSSVLTFALAACSAQPQTKVELTQVRTRPDITNFEKWHEVTAEPVMIDARSIPMCLGVSPIALGETKTNDTTDEKFSLPQPDARTVHFESELGSELLSEVGSVRIFVNPIGESAFLKQKKPKFPEGTVIVKVRHDGRTNGTSETAVKSSSKPGEVKFLTVMQKLPAGTSPETGDWQYLVYAPDATTELKKHNLPNCQSCHEQWKNTDYVSREYLTKDQVAKLK